MFTHSVMSHTTQLHEMLFSFSVPLTKYSAFEGSIRPLDRLVGNILSQRLSKICLASAPLCSL